MPKAIIISRVSDPSQVEAGNSLPAQTRRMKDYLKRQQFNLIKEYSFDESAYKDKRDDFDEIINFIKTQKEEIIVCFDKVDRFSRNVFDQRVAYLYELAISGKIELHFVSDSQIIGSNISASDKFRFSMSLGLAKYYSDAISDNVKRAQEQKLRKGEYPSGARFGYKNITIDNDKKWIASDEFKSLIVKDIFNSYVSGNYSILELSKKIKNDYNINKSKGAIHIILNDKFYIGIMTWNNHEYPHNYEKLIDIETFEKAQAIMHGRKDKNKPFKYAGKPFAYRGLLRCHECGCSMTPQVKKRKLTNGKYNHHTYYSCTNHHKTHDKVAHIKESIIDKQFADVFKALAIPADKLNEISSVLKEAHKNKNQFYETQVKHFNQELQRHKNRIEVAYEDRLDLSITKEQYEEIRKKSQKEIDQIKISIDKLDFAEKEYYLTTARLVELGSRSAEIFRRSKPMEKRTLINFVLSNATLSNDKVLYTAKFPFSIVLKYGHRTTMLPCLNAVRTHFLKDIIGDLDIEELNLSVVNDRYSIQATHQY